jgi:hypothetical protein
MDFFFNSSIGKFLFFVGCVALFWALSPEVRAGMRRTLQKLMARSDFTHAELDGAPKMPSAWASALVGWFRAKSVGTRFAIAGALGLTLLLFQFFGSSPGSVCTRGVSTAEDMSNIRSTGINISVINVSGRSLGGGVVKCYASIKLESPDVKDFSPTMMLQYTVEQTDGDDMVRIDQ